MVTDDFSFDVLMNKILAVVTVFMLLTTGVVALVYFKHDDWTYSYWGNLRALWDEGHCYGSIGISKVHDKISVRFTCPESCYVKGVYGDINTGEIYTSKMRMGIQKDSNGYPNGIWLGYWENYMDIYPEWSRPIFLFLDGDIWLSKDVVYHIVFELIERGNRGFGIQVYRPNQQYHSYDWHFDAELALLEWPDASGSWFYPELGFHHNDGTVFCRPIPAVCLVKSDDSNGFPIFGIDIFKCEPWVDERTEKYEMKNFPLTLIADQLLLKLARKTNIGNIILKITNGDESQILAEKSFPVTELPRGEEETTADQLWYMPIPYVWKFHPIKLREGETYRIIIISSEENAYKVGCVMRPQSSNMVDLLAGTFYGSDFKRLGQAQPSYGDIIFGFRVRAI